MIERLWSYTTPNPHRTPVSIEVGGDAEVLEELGGIKVAMCKRCGRTRHVSSVGDECRMDGVPFVAGWIVLQGVADG